jgi:hypothetical protein
VLVTHRFTLSDDQQRQHHDVIFPLMNDAIKSRAQIAIARQLTRISCSKFHAEGFRHRLNNTFTLGASSLLHSMAISCQSLAGIIETPSGVIGVYEITINLSKAGDAWPTEKIAFEFIKNRRPRRPMHTCDRDALSTFDRCHTVHTRIDSARVTKS